MSPGRRPINSFEMNNSSPFNCEACVTPSGARRAFQAGLVVALTVLVGLGSLPDRIDPAALFGDEAERAVDGTVATMTARGFVRFEGEWRTPQEVVLKQREEASTRARLEATARLQRLRLKLNDAATADEAAEEIRESADPHAVSALSEAVRDETDRRVRSLFIESLGRIESPEAFAILVSIAIDHPDRETRYLSCERLAASHAHQAIQMAVSAVGGPDNARLNRAAAAVGWIAKSAELTPQQMILERLVDALETNHVIVGGGDGSTSATFTPSGGGLALGGGPKTASRIVQNVSVQETLVAITGVDFGFDRRNWQNWLSTRDLPVGADLRRDP